MITCFSAGWQTIVPMKQEGEKAVALPKNTKIKNEILLVEFKAPKELVEAFDDKLRSKFSNRSEAIRSLMRTFLEATKKEN